VKSNFCSKTALWEWKNCETIARWI